MGQWITDRTQSNVNHVKEITAKAKTGTWTKTEQSEWLAGMKGALNYTDFNRIESGIQELASIVGANVSVKTDWLIDGYMKQSDAVRWLSNIAAIKSKCAGLNSTPDVPASMDRLSFSAMNQIEQVLYDIEMLAKTRVTFSGEFTCGEGQYGF